MSVMQFMFKFKELVTNPQVYLVTLEMIETNFTLRSESFNLCAFSYFVISDEVELVERSLLTKRGRCFSSHHDDCVWILAIDRSS